MAKKLVVDPRLEQQENVNAYFQAESSHWKDVYSTHDVQAEIIQDRHAAILDWVDRLALATGSRVLEIGCGAGFMALALAQRGLRVHAIDSVEAMIELARNNTPATGLANKATFDVGDVYSLAFDDASFDLVIAIGVIPWLEQADLAIQEMARVTKPGGSVIVTTANSAGLASLLDPIICPALRPLKLGIKKVLMRFGLRAPAPSMVFHGNRSFESMLSHSGFVKVKGMTRGFGFSFFRHSVLPEPLAISINRKLQRLADRGIPGFRSTGMAYFVLARRSVAQSLAHPTSVRKDIDDATVVS